MKGKVCSLVPDFLTLFFSVSLVLWLVTFPYSPLFSNFKVGLAVPWTHHAISGLCTSVCVCPGNILFPFLSLSKSVSCPKHFSCVMPLRRFSGPSPTWLIKLPLLFVHMVYPYYVTYNCFLPTGLEWRRKWQPTPVLLPGESHGQRSLAGYSPVGLPRVGLHWATKH